MPVALDLGLDGTEAGVHVLSDHAARARHVEEELTCGRGRVEVLLIEVEINADSFEILDGAQEIDEGAAVYGPGHDHITGGCVLEHSVEA